MGVEFNVREESGMTFNQAVEHIMPEVRNGSIEPFIIYRDSGGDWHSDFINNQYGEVFDWVEDAKAKDPLAVIMTGKDFAKGSYPYVYDAVLVARLRAEYAYAAQSGAVTGANYKELYALVNFFDDNVGEFSHKLTDYLGTLERPLAALQEMCPFSLTTDYEGWTYDEESAQKAIDYIENEVNDRLHSYPDDVVPEKRSIEGYEEKSSLQIAGRIVILAEKPGAEEPYMVANCRWDNPFNMKEYYNAVVTADYFGAIGEFIKRQSAFLEQLENEHSESGLPFHTLTAADCLPHAMDGNITGKVIVIKPEILSPEYRTENHQLKLCTGGNGTRPEARGSAVFCTDLYSGQSSRFERWDVAGVIDPEKMPEWAKDSLSARMNQKANIRISDVHKRVFGHFVLPRSYARQIKNCVLKIIRQIKRHSEQIHIVARYLLCKFLKTP